MTTAPEPEQSAAAPADVARAGAPPDGDTADEWGAALETGRMQIGRSEQPGPQGIEQAPTFTEPEPDTGPEPHLPDDLAAALLDLVDAMMQLPRPELAELVAQWSADIRKRLA